ncbi:MAG: hypothetical protein EBE86_030905 [Hormoscilla sp. GUM202]|nr:hypothetical protein [Hormoscilla sp. GUM202]
MRVVIYVEGSSDESAMKALLAPLIADRAAWRSHKITARYRNSLCFC